MRLYFLFLWLLVPLVIGWWPFDDNHDDVDQAKDTSTQGGPSVVPFEIMSAEQKFLQEAKELLNLSPLDSCQHKVVDSLRKACGKLSEEDIAKLSVQLLNCQSQSEGREVYSCTQDMSIAECTRPMDAHTWNAYHIISNRARSVCYTVRQTQFRMQTEAAVNRLTQSAVYQLKTMEELSTSQDEIRQSTQTSLDVLKREKDELTRREKDLSAYQDKLKKAMEDNIDQLAEERLIITTGQTLIHNMTKSIENQLRVAEEMLKDQETSRQQHQQLMSDEMAQMKQNIKEVWSTIDNSTLKLLVLVDQLNTQYGDMQTRLTTINNTISHVLAVLDSMNEVVAIQLGWLVDSMGGAQDGLYVLVTIATHGVFLLVGCLVLLFLKAPWLSRLMLLILVVFNLLIDINTTIGALSMGQLVVLLGIILIGDFLFLSYYNGPQRKRFAAISSTPPPPSSTSTSRHSIDISDDEVDYLLNSSTSHIIKHTPPKLLRNSCSTPITAGRIEEFAGTPNTTTGTMMGTINSSGGTSKCCGLTRTGLPCKLSATPGSSYCYRHANK